jgi:hypothetical protein
MAMPHTVPKAAARSVRSAAGAVAQAAVKLRASSRRP